MQKYDQKSSNLGGRNMAESVITERSILGRGSRDVNYNISSK